MEEVNSEVQRMEIFSFKICSRAVRTVVVRRGDFYSTLPHLACSGNIKKLKWWQLSFVLHEKPWTELGCWRYLPCADGRGWEKQGQRSRYQWGCGCYGIRLATSYIRDDVLKFNLTPITSYTRKSWTTQKGGSLPLSGSKTICSGELVFILREHTCLLVQEFTHRWWEKEYIRIYRNEIFTVFCADQMWRTRVNLQCIPIFLDSLFVIVWLFLLCGHLIFMTLTSCS